jgi:hypothetical protein
MTIKSTFFQCEDMYMLLLCHVMDVCLVFISSPIAYYFKSIRYNLNNISVILYSFLTYPHCRKKPIMVLPKGSLKHISPKLRIFDCQDIMLGGRVLMDVCLVFISSPIAYFKRQSSRHTLSVPDPCSSTKKLISDHLI